MIDIQKKIQSRLVQKKISNLTEWYLCNSSIKSFLQNKLQCTNIKINWKIKNNILFISLYPKNLSFEVFLNKNKIIKNINDNFIKYWINNYIKDIIVK